MHARLNCYPHFTKPYFSFGTESSDDGSLITISLPDNEEDDLIVL